MGGRWVMWLESHEDSCRVRWRVWRRGQGQGIPGKIQSWKGRSRTRGCSQESKLTGSRQRNLEAEEELGPGREARVLSLVSGIW